MSGSYKENDDNLNEKPIQSFAEGSKIHFAERLKCAIGDESILSFAKKCGLSDTLIGRYLKGASVPGIDKLPQIAAASGKPISWFFGENVEEQHEHNEHTSSQDELDEWWHIISRSMSKSELITAIESFKIGGKKAIFNEGVLSSESTNDLKLSRTSIHTAMMLEALDPEVRKEILARYGISEQGISVAPTTEPQNAKKAG